ncbi:hypothetical protein [Agarivorans sp. B2Z047]|uniref:DUF6988 family protein n=1 Tax=Agarivorans sp. B2Z047 TaxID=2652721 RepID=UPI0018832661|nr:hypothetical protein [Agarivorans sp. B2Z047]UQN44602.1 hypothetical protein LQZ07_09100 [Agarivorans sp. B2Z047]
MSTEYEKYMDAVFWIDETTSGLVIPADERSLLASGCFDVALEHQAAIGLLYSSQLYGSVMSILRVLTESVVRGLWILYCASDIELKKFKKRKIDKSFGTLVSEYESKIDDKDFVLSKFKGVAWKSMNDFTHTGFMQVSRRHLPGKISADYDATELNHALGVAGALGFIAAGQLVGMAGRADLTQPFLDKMQDYGNVQP